MFYLTIILQWYCVLSIGLSALRDIKVQNENIFLNTFLTDLAGMIAPWHADEQGAGDFLLSKFQLREGNGAVEVLEKGLYYIYAQVYYTTTESSNSFSIKLREKGKSSHEELAVCSVNIAVKQYMSEVSCFTSVVRFLNATDRVFLWQRERNRRMVLRNGFSFFGFVHLSGKRD